MRLDKFVSQQLEISRKQVGLELRAGKVTVDHVIVKSGCYKLSVEQQVAYDNNLLQKIQGARYFMLNKPSGYICSTNDPTHPTIGYFINEPMVSKLHSAGRLDMDATGLVLLTDDGQWSHRITSPRNLCEKTYLITLTEPLSMELEKKFTDGIQLRNEKTLTKPAKLELLDTYTARLTIVEGRYHQVKRMFAATGNHVVSLHRERIGKVNLDITLKPGEYRSLKMDELNSFV